MKKRKNTNIINILTFIIKKTYVHGWVLIILSHISICNSPHTGHIMCSTRFGLWLGIALKWCSSSAHTLEEIGLGLVNKCSKGIV